MSNLKHTPGPWHWRPSDQNGYTILSSDNNPNRAIVSAFYADVAYGDYKLIAAAPEMLEALIDIYEVGNITKIGIKRIIEKATGMSIDEILK